jgi:hypothetical protein
MNSTLYKFRVFSRLENKYLPSYADKGLLFQTNYGREGSEYQWVGVDWFISAMAAEHPVNYIVEQFTGLIDYNNKEIYIGDIVRTTGYCSLIPNPNIDETHIVNFRNGRLNICDYADCDNRVMGNVNQNPERLLK